MSHIPKVFQALGKLVGYPDASTVQTAELLYVVLQGELDGAARSIAEFGAYAEGHDLWELEEAFTRTFDINPLSALEVGWHLFGEEYARGMFLVRMREEMRKYGIPESAELPDHLSHVLAIVSAMPEAEATRFVKACVQPAVEIMKQSLAEKETPYRHIMECLAAVLTYVWGAPAPAATHQGESPGRRPFESDPLNAFPVADVGCGCHEGGCASGLVQLQSEPELAVAPTVVVAAVSRSLP